ncbi:MAG: carbohydrate-binding family 9-like protein [Thermoanaerobaculia bacterium]
MRGTGLAMCSLLPALALTLGVAGRPPPRSRGDTAAWRWSAVGAGDRREERSGPGSARRGAIRSSTSRATAVRRRCTDAIPFRDERALYVLAELEEPHLYATLTEHDAVIFHDPDFEIFLDPEGDRRNYFEPEVNALGTTWDLRLDRPYHESGKPDDAWELTGLGLAIEPPGA